MTRISGSVGSRREQAAPVLVALYTEGVDHREEEPVGEGRESAQSPPRSPSDAAVHHSYRELSAGWPHGVPEASSPLRSGSGRPGDSGRRTAGSAGRNRKGGNPRLAGPGSLGREMPPAPALARSGSRWVMRSGSSPGIDLARVVATATSPTETAWIQRAPAGKVGCRRRSPSRLPRV